MLQIEDTVISLDLFEREFVCDLSVCKGECCVQGEEGAPLEADEAQHLEAVLPLVWDTLSEASREVIAKKGVSYIDRTGDEVTALVGDGECVFVYHDENGYAKCAVEKAFLEGKTDFRKPISCYLYPVRTERYKDFTAVNYHRWHVCRCAEHLGRETKTPVYRFLKEPLTRKFGEEWYRQVEIAAQEVMSYKL